MVDREFKKGTGEIKVSAHPHLKHSIQPLSSFKLFQSSIRYWYCPCSLDLGFECCRNAFEGNSEWSCLQGAGAQVKDRIERVAAGEGLRPVLLFPEVSFLDPIFPDVAAMNLIIQ